jgi:hypothetical protein
MRFHVTTSCMPAYNVSQYHFIIALDFANKGNTYLHSTPLDIHMTMP